MRLNIINVINVMDWVQPLLATEDVSSRTQVTFHGLSMPGSISLS
jgi:hypothetical protein